MKITEDMLIEAANKLSQSSAEVSITPSKAGSYTVTAHMTERSTLSADTIASLTVKYGTKDIFIEPTDDRRLRVSIYGVAAEKIASLIVWE